MMQALNTKVAALRIKLAGTLKSKTVWFNAILLGLLDQLPDILAQVSTSLPDIQPYIGPTLYHNITVLLVIGNLYLKFHKTPSKKPEATP